MIHYDSYLYIYIYLANHGFWALLESCNPFVVIGRSHSLPRFTVTLAARFRFHMSSTKFVPVQVLWY